MATTTTTLQQPPPITLPEIQGVKFGDFVDPDGSLLQKVITLMEKDLSEPYNCFTYRYFLHGFPQLTIVATSDDEEKRLIGVIVAKADRENKRKRLRGYIAMLAVEEKDRKRGIGNALAVRVIQRMRDMGCDEVVLETEMSNTAALAFYIKLGFSKSKRLSRYYLNGGDAFRLKVWFTSPSWADNTVTPPGPIVLGDGEATATTTVDNNNVDAVPIAPQPTSPNTTPPTDNNNTSGSDQKKKKNTGKKA